MNKRIVFLTGTRADFGKLKSLIKITQESERYDVHIFSTGMHLSLRYGKTINEIYKSGFNNIYPFINHDSSNNMDRNLAKTIEGFSLYVQEMKPDLIVVHGDRVEAMAGAIVGSLNNILVAHIEGGEVSGTVDELIRHSVSKLSHIHLVSNEEAKKRLLQMGELNHTVFNIGSPDLDLMNIETLPSLEFVRDYYNIAFDSYAILMFHPVTTEYDNISEYAKQLVDAVIESDKKYIAIFPNNDLGSNEIIKEYQRLEKHENFRVFSSLRFEYFLTLLYYSEFMIGNSSAGVREAPFYSVPTIDIGTRQKNRSSASSIVHSGYKKADIMKAIQQVRMLARKEEKDLSFGEGNSNKKFFQLLESEDFWGIECQKQFQDIS